MRFAVPEKTRFYYKLDGLESDWIMAVNENFVRYNNLSPGTYTFLLKACNEDGYCDEQTQELTFIIANTILSNFLVLGSPYYRILWNNILYLSISHAKFKEGVCS